MGVDDKWTWLRTAVDSVSGDPEHARGRVIAGVALAVAARNEIRLPALALLGSWGPPAEVTIPDAVVADAWLVGSSLEVLLDVGERRRGGAHYTPRHLAQAVTTLVLDGVAVDGSTTVCDPAVGGGSFLLAAGEALVAVGRARCHAVHRLAGVDVDPLAAAVAEAALCLWAGGRRGATIEVADALARPVDAWGGPTIVVGNPPFLGQLHAATARSADRSGLRPGLAELAGPYTDTSSLFAALAVDVVAPGGRVALVLPRSFLVARDAGAARAATLRAAHLDHVWLPGRQVFAAAVDVCVPVWERRVGDDPEPTAVEAQLVLPWSGSVRRSIGVPPVPAPVAATPAGSGARRSWSHLLSGLTKEAEVPSLDGLRSLGVLGDHCTATAGFRDQYYGLIPFVSDDLEGLLDDRTHAPLVTSGLIDPASCAWGEQSTRYAGRRWQAPRVDVAAVEAEGGPLARWLGGKRVPKLLVAAQTRTIEAAVDVDGTWVPSTPVATVVAAPGRQWHMLAVLLSPVATVWALRHHGGSGMGATSFRLPPSGLRSLPLPADRAMWDEAAEAARSATLAAGADARGTHLMESARLTCQAYGVPDEPVTAWWAARSPFSR